MPPLKEYVQQNGTHRRVFCPNKRRPRLSLGVRCQPWAAGKPPPEQQAPRNEKEKIQTKVGVGVCVGGRCPYPSPTDAPTRPLGQACPSSGSTPPVCTERLRSRSRSRSFVRSIDRKGEWGGGRAALAATSTDRHNIYHIRKAEGRARNQMPHFLFFAFCCARARANRPKVFHFLVCFLLFSRWGRPFAGHR